MMLRTPKHPQGSTPAKYTGWPFPSDRIVRIRPLEPHPSRTAPAGEYGAGKTFFLNLVRLIALERKLVTIHADLAPDRRLLGRDGQARGLYAESVRNMATRTKPDGGALASVKMSFVKAPRGRAAKRHTSGQ